MNDRTFSAVMHVPTCCATVLAVKVKPMVIRKRPSECAIVLEERKESMASGG